MKPRLTNQLGGWGASAPWLQRSSATLIYLIAMNLMIVCKIGYQCFKSVVSTIRNARVENNVLCISVHCQGEDIECQSLALLSVVFVIKK